MRKIKSSILIVAILTLMVHDLIPHHHHSTGAYLSTELCFEKEHDHCAGEGNEEESRKSDPDCPGCSSIQELIVTIPDLIHSLPAKELSKKQATGNLAIEATLSLMPAGTTYLAEIVYSRPERYLNPYLSGPNGMRAPPSV